MLNSRIPLLLLLSILSVFAGCAENTAKNQKVIEASTNTPQPSISPDQVAHILNTVRNEVNGIAIGDREVELLEKFGKPKTKKTEGKNPCGDVKTVWGYDGIIFTLDGKRDESIIVEIEIVSPQWKIAPGINVGDGIEDVHSKMKGQGLFNDEDNSLSYGDGDGFIAFHLTDGKVSKIIRTLNMC